VERNSEYQLAKLYAPRGVAYGTQGFDGVYDPGWWGGNPAAFSGKIPVFNCPSNPNVLFEGRGQHTYSINNGTSHPVHIGANGTDACDNRSNGVSAFIHENNPGASAPAVNFGRIIDGSSNTVAYSEFVVQDNTNFTVQPVVGFDKRKLRSQFYQWATGTDTATVRDSCRNMITNSARYDWRGRSYSWAFPQVGGTYNHTMLPNERSCWSWCGDWGGSSLFSASSEHPGGAQIGLCDGSVTFASETIDRNVWWAIGTRAGGEKETLTN
jgi:prepilin-type processing-associated H-X9-DG protein